MFHCPDWDITVKPKKILGILLILSLGFALIELSQAQAQVSLSLERITWDHSTIRALLTPPANESWWDPSYLNATLRAIGQWNHAILDFTSNYTDYAYLSKLRVAQTTSYSTSTGFDVYISWTEKSPSSGDEIGYANTSYTQPSGIIVDSRITLASKTLEGYVLNEFEMQNIALHELGHSLGLSHSNTDKDIMYPKITLNPLTPHVEELSTLDLYGVSTVFQWMENPSNLPNSPGQSSVTLPPSITYQFLPPSYEDLPPDNQSISVWQPLLTQLLNLLDNILQLLMRPEILVILAATIALLVVIFILARPQKTKTEQDQTPPPVTSL